MTDQNKPTAETTGTAVAAPARKLDLAAIGGERRGGGAMFLPSTMQECLDFATIMSKSDFAIPPPFRGNPGACLAVTIQASRWQADPFGVIQKAYVTTSKGGDQRISYEAQLVAAVVNTRANLAGRLELIYSGEGNKRRVKVIGTFADTGEIREIETPPISQIHPKNSPLWTSDPDQQLAYYGMRSWGRRWTPEVLLGIYTPEELAEEISEQARNAPRPVRTDHRIAEPAANVSAEETGIIRAPEAEPAIEAETEDLPVVETEELSAPISKDEAARMDVTLVPAGDDHTVRAAEHGIAGEGLEPNEDNAEEDFRTSAAWAEWEKILVRSIEGLMDGDLRAEADFDDYGNKVKAAIKDAPLTDDEKDDLRARFVSAFLNRKRDAGFGRRR